jgi:chromosome segregation ATPase
VGLFDETGETPPNRDGAQPASSKDASLSDWLVRKAEADLGLARAFAAGETERADQIKRLEATLVSQITALQRRITERREAEIDDLKSEICACADRLARIETAKTAGEATKEFVRDKLGLLCAQLSGLQTELDSRHSGLERLGESLGSQIRALEEHVGRELDGVQSVHAELRHWKSETKSLAERIGEAESSAWQTRTLASRNAERIEQTTDILKSELVALKALYAELNEQQRNLHPDTLLREFAHTTGVKIEQILGQLAENDQAQVGRDERLGRLDAGLAALAERVKKAETLSQDAQALAQTEAASAPDFRAQVARELAALDANVNAAQARLPAIEDRETLLRAKLDELHQWSAQKLVLLENRGAEQEKLARELGASLEAKLAEQEERAAERLGALASTHERLLGFEPEVRALAQRIGQLESLAQSVQSQADAGAARASELEESLKNAIAGIGAEIAEFAERQSAIGAPDEQMRELEHRLGVKIADLHRELVAEREGFDYWGKGLRESFAAELSAMQARLSVRQGEIEYRQSRLEERFEENVKTSVSGLAAKLNENLQRQERDQEQWANLRSELGALGERTSGLEFQGNRIENRVATSGQEFENRLAELRAEIVAVKNSLEQSSTGSAESVVLSLEQSLRANFCELEERTNEKFHRQESRDSERAAQTKKSISAFTAELDSLKTAVDQRLGGMPSAEGLAHAVEESLKSRIFELDQKFADLLNVDREAARRAQETVQALQDAIAALQGDMSALKAGISERPQAQVGDSAVQHLEESFGTKIHDLQQQLAQKLDLFDQRDAEQRQQAERLIARLDSDMAALKLDLSRPAVITAGDPALRALEESLGAKIRQLHQLFESRDAEVKELNDRSQSLTERVAQLSSVIRSAQGAGPAVVQALPERPKEVAVPQPEPVAKTVESRPKGQAPSEKEQLSRLQERMSAEIERVRAELKERSGRWKVRKSAP